MTTRHPRPRLLLRLLRHRLLPLRIAAVEVVHPVVRRIRLRSMGPQVHRVQVLGRAG